MWPSAVCAFADQLDLEPIGRRGERSGIGHYLPDGEATIDVPAENGAHVVESAGLEDGLCPFTDFLCWLEHDEYVAVRRAPCE